MKTRKHSTASTAILATTGMLAFYAFAYAAPSIPGLEELGSFVRRYFCGHPIEYISTVMFFSGMAILFQKYRQLKAERSALRLANDSVGTAAAADGELSSRETSLTDWCDSQNQLQHTQQHIRMRNVVQYVNGSGRAGLEEHLRYLAELAAERLHQTYATIRTITWAIPILGFLGTVIGITMAIANVTPEQLDTSLTDVTTGLSTAFDTTALALGMSIAMVFASYSVERAEQQVLNDVEQFGIETLLPWLNVAKSEQQQSQHFSASQSHVWNEQLTELKSTWHELLQSHADNMRLTLDSEVQQTLKIHREHSADTRDAYAEAIHQSSATIVDQTESLLASFEERINTWQDALMTSSQNSVQQSEALHGLGATLLRMTETEERLTQLQKLLTDNLQALRVADTMEQTASSLTAAVHVLTAKTNTRRAA